MTWQPRQGSARTQATARPLQRLIPPLAALMAMTAFASGCSRSTGSKSADRDKSRAASPAAVALAPSYRGEAGMNLTFFSDCHVELDGEDSVHFRKDYRVDARRRVIQVGDLMELHEDDAGALVDSSERDGSLWQKLDGHGEWTPLDGTHRLRLPRDCGTP